MSRRLELKIEVYFFDESIIGSSFAEKISHFERLLRVLNEQELKKYYTDESERKLYFTDCKIIEAIE